MKNNIMFINKNRIRKDVKCGDLLMKNNGWYVPATKNLLDRKFKLEVISYGNRKIIFI